MKTVLYFQSSLCACNVAELGGAGRFARQAGWRLQVLPCGAAAVCRQRMPKLSGVRELMSLWQPDGVIVDCGGLAEDVSVEMFARKPLVLLDHSGDVRADAVVSDAGAIAEVAARALLRLDCQVYGFVPLAPTCSWSARRGEAFEKMIRLSGGQFVEFGLANNASPHYRKRLGQWLKSLPRPVGLFAANDLVGADVLSCAAHEGLTVGKDAYVVGVDNDEQICETTTPTLSSIRPDYDVAGYVAASLLAERMAHPRRRFKVLTFGSPVLVGRSSTCSFRRCDKRVQIALDLVRRKASEGLSAFEVVKAMGCSRRLAEMRFREVTGYSILSAIQGVRLERAIELLRQDRMPLSEIARCCGYGSTESLRKVFHARFGLSAQAWRKTLVLRDECE